MKTSIEKLKFGNINAVPLPAPASVVTQVKRLVDFVLQKNKVEQLLEHVAFAKIYRIRDKYYFSQHYFLFAELAARAVSFELDFVVVQLKRSVTFAQLRAKILHQIEVESLLTTDAKVAYALSYSFDKKATLFRQVDYTKILQCHRRALRHKDKLFEKTEVLAETPFSAVDVDVLLSDVPVLQESRNE